MGNVDVATQRFASEQASNLPGQEKIVGKRKKTKPLESSS